MSKEESLKLLTIAAKYYNDKDTQMNTPALNEEQIEAGYISTTKYTKAQIDEAYNYLLNNSQGQTFIDTYKEDMTSQPYFTSTDEQYKNSNWKPDSTKGLEDNSLTFVPRKKGTGTFFIYVSNDIDQNIYATNFGEDLAFYTNGALNIITGGNLASINNHNNGIVTQVPSVFNNSNNLLNSNNQEFASLDKSGGDDSPLLIIPALLAVQSYLNAPKDETDVNEGMTGSENLLLGAGVVSNTGKIYTTGKEAVQTVLKYDPSLAITGVGVSTGMSAYTNYDKYNGVEYVTHVGIDGTISYLVGKYIPAGQNIASNIGYGALGGGLSGVSTESAHQYLDIQNDKQDEFTVEKIFLNSGIESTAGALGKTYKNIGEILELKPVINYGMDIGASQSFKPVVESTMLNDVNKEEGK